jgi:hypothetical protein
MYLLLAVLILPFMLAISGCKKDKQTQGDPNAPVEVSFNVNNVTNGLKADPPECQVHLASYALITIKDAANVVTTYKLDVYYIGNIPYTKALKLSPGAYIIQEFLVYWDGGTPGTAPFPNTDDELLWATPHSGAAFATFLSAGMALEKNFVIEAFKKLELEVEVVCYEEEDYLEFGFIYFQIDQIIVREHCFFGDLCIKSLDDYNIPGTTDYPNYYTIANGGPITTYDLVAIFKIEVWRNQGAGWVHQLPDYSNAPYMGPNGWIIPTPPLCVQYGDYVNVTDQFEFKLFVWARVGAGFNWVQFNGAPGMINPWTFTDICNLIAGTDNITDWVIGTCVQSTSDYVWPPYMNLPLTCTYQITEAPAVAPADAYVGFTLGGFGAGYDITPGHNHGFCADKNHVIYIGTVYNMNVRSSLYPGSFPCVVPGMEWGQMNWVVNHYFTPPTNWNDIQCAFWILNNNWNDPIGTTYSGVTMTAAGQAIAAAAHAAVPHGGSFMPLPGGWACVVFFNQQNCEGTQLMIMKVDP